jgi:chromosome segregation ATPase
MGTAHAGGCGPPAGAPTFKKMPVFIISCGALLVFAVTTALLSLGYQPATLVALFLSLPVLQQIVWLVICLVPPALLAVSLLQHCMLIGQRNAGDALEARLRGIRLDVRGLGQAQKDNDDATQYLHRSDPEDAISALQVQIKHSEQAVQLHQQQNQSSNLIARVEEIRQQQKETRDRLGDSIGKRRSLLAQIQTSQDDMERTMSAIEQDKNGAPIEDRLQKLSEFIGTANSRCEEIERSMPGLSELEKKFDALAIRVAPLDEKENGVIDVLKALSDVQNRLAVTIARLERHEGVCLAERIQQLAEAKGELEEQVSKVLSQFSAIETIHKDITGLFAKLSHAQRPETSFEVVTPINLFASARTG